MIRLPDELKSKVQAIQAGEIRIAIPTDISRDGRFGIEWFVVVDEHVLVLDSEAGEVIHSIPFDEFDELAVDDLVGRALVLTKKEEEKHPILSFSVAANEEVREAIGRINAWKKGEEPKEKAEKDKRYCETCGKPLPKLMNTCPRCVDRRRVFVSLWGFSRRYLKTMCLQFFTMVVGTCFGLLTPYMSKILIDTVFIKDEAGNFPNGGLLPWVTLVLLGSYAAAAFIHGLSRRLSGTMGFSVVADVRGELYEKLQSMSLAFFDKHQTGALLARVNQDTQELRHLLVGFLPTLVECGLMFVGIGILLVVLSWQLTCFILIPVAAVILFVKLVIPRLMIRFHRFFHRRGKLSAIVSDSLSGIRVVKAFGQEEEEVRKFHSWNESYKQSGIEVEKTFSIFHPLIDMIVMSGSVIVWFVGGHLIFDGHMTLGAVVAYSGYLMMFYRPVFMLSRISDIMTHALAAAERVIDVLETDPLILDSPDAKAMPAIKGELAFNNVTFGYDRFKPVIKDMELKIEANEMVGLVGKSGAGKSTVINLLCRLYDVDNGAIEIDGTDVRNIKIEDLRRQIGVVLQDTFLFNGSIYENIRYARPDATKEDVIRAAIAANAHEFILQKPDGYDSEVGEKGGKLSGGEKQRIAIARAILRDPRILILDEATSSVDTETEKKIHEALQRLVKGRTTIAIAHRLSTLNTCNRLIVIKDGEVAEIGTHEELLAKEGIFYDLVQAQERLSKIVAVER